MNKLNYIFVLCMTLFLVSSVNAGVGIKWAGEPILVEQGETSCVSYKVYNPWPEGTDVKLELSDELSSILSTRGAESVFIPADTSSSEAIPVEFCFAVPSDLYTEDCILGLFCKQECSGESKVYDGEVIVSSFSKGKNSGSATEASVLAPLKLKVSCDDSRRNYTPIYVLIAVISLVGISASLRGNLTSKKRK